MKFSCVFNQPVGFKCHSPGSWRLQIQRTLDPSSLPPPSFRDQHFSATNILRWHSIGFNHHSGLRCRIVQSRQLREIGVGQSSTLINALTPASIGGPRAEESCDARSTLNRAPAPPILSCSVKVVASPATKNLTADQLSQRRPPPSGRPLLFFIRNEPAQSLIVVC